MVTVATVATVATVVAVATVATASASHYTQIQILGHSDRLKQLVLETIGVWEIVCLYLQSIS